MPFDGRNTRGATAAHVINLMIEMFNDGKGWRCGWKYERSKESPHSRCLMSAVMAVQARDHINGGVTEYLARAIDEFVEYEGGPRAAVFHKDLASQFEGWTRNVSKVIAFNDSWMSLASDRYKTVIEPMLLQARQIAQEDI